MNFLMTIKSLIICVCIKQCFGGTKPTFLRSWRIFFLLLCFMSIKNSSKLQNTRRFIHFILFVHTTQQSKNKEILNHAPTNKLRHFRDLLLQLVLIIQMLILMLTFKSGRANNVMLKKFAPSVVRYFFLKIWF